MPRYNSLRSLSVPSSRPNSSIHTRPGPRYNSSRSHFVSRSRPGTRPGGTRSGAIHSSTIRSIRTLSSSSRKSSSLLSTTMNAFPHKKESSQHSTNNNSLRGSNQPKGLKYDITKMGKKDAFKKWDPYFRDPKRTLPWGHSAKDHLPFGTLERSWVLTISAKRSNSYVRGRRFSSGRLSNRSQKADPYNTYPPSFGIPLPKLDRVDTNQRQKKWSG